MPASGTFFAIQRLRFLLLAIALPAPFAAAAPLVELLQLAEQHYSGYRLEELRYQIEKEAEPIARAALFPQASASVGQQYSDQSDESSWSAGVSLEQELYNLPLWHLWQGSKEQVKRAEINRQIARAQLRRDVILAWLEVQLTAETLQLLETRRNTLREQLKRTETLADSGQVIKADVLSARAGLANARSQWEQSRHDLAVAHDVIYRYTAATATDLRLAPDAPLPPLRTLQEWQQTVEQNNLELKAARQQTAYLRRRLQAAADAVYPRLSFSGRLSTEEGEGNIRDNWQLSLQQSLFTGGNLRAQQRQIIAEADSGHAQVASLLEQNTQTIKRLHGQMRADLARITALEEAAEAAEALLQVVIVGYENGVNVITDVLSAEEDAFDARLNLRQAAYSYLRNLTTLQALAADNDDAFAAQVEQFFIPVNH